MNGLIRLEKSAFVTLGNRFKMVQRRSILSWNGFRSEKSGFPLCCGLKTNSRIVYFYLKIISQLWELVENFMLHMSSVPFFVKDTEELLRECNTNVRGDMIMCLLNCC